METLAPGEPLATRLAEVGQDIAALVVTNVVLEARDGPASVALNDPAAYGTGLLQPLPESDGDDVDADFLVASKNAQSHVHFGPSFRTLGKVLAARWEQT